MEFLSKRLKFTALPKQQFERQIKLIDSFQFLWKVNHTISPQILHRLKKYNLITSSGASTRIEGSYLSDEQVEKLLSGLKIQKLKDRSQQEVAGYAELQKLILDNFRHIHFRESTIKQFHRILLQYSKKDDHHRGNYKIGPNSVVARDSAGNESIIFNPTSPHLTAKEMQELCCWTQEHLKKKEFHPLLVIGNFIVEFLSIHPFQDGNGRLSRALTNLLLLKSGYLYVQYTSLEKIIEKKKEEYYLALRKSQKNREKKRENIKPWIYFFFESLLEQTEYAQGIIERKNREEELSLYQIRVLKLMRENLQEMSVKEIVEKTNIGRETVRKILQRLQKLEFVKMLGLGRATRWQAFKKTD